MTRHYQHVLAILLFVAMGGAQAQSLYKSVNEHGEVTFSDQPPETAVEIETVEVAPGPSAERQRESTERVRQIEALADELGESNAAREQQRIEAREQAQQRALQDAQEPPVSYTDGRNYPNRPVYPSPGYPSVRPPVRPEHPIAPRPPGRPVTLPASPAPGPGR